MKRRTMRIFYLEFEEFLLGQKQLPPLLNSLWCSLHSFNQIHHFVHCLRQLPQLLLDLVCVPNNSFPQPFSGDSKIWAVMSATVFVQWNSQTRRRKIWFEILNRRSHQIVVYFGRNLLLILYRRQRLFLLQLDDFFQLLSCYFLTLLTTQSLVGKEWRFAKSSCYLVKFLKWCISNFLRVSKIRIMSVTHGSLGVRLRAKILRWKNF